MRPDQCHGEPKPAEIKPDTSLYDKKGDRLRAMGAVFDAQEAGGLVQYKSRNGPSGWSDIPHAAVDSLNYDYRIKPKPRELWKLCLGDAMVERNFSEQRYAENFRAASSGLAEYSVVRFVEQP